MDDHARCAQRARCTDVDLRAAHRILSQRQRHASHVRGRAARRLCRGERVHARRADADHRASVLRLVGLPDDRLLRADQPRYGTPQDFMFLVDVLHRRGIGVILDWVPSLFPAATPHGLAYFDGTHLFEHADPRQAFHPDWGSVHLQLRPAARCGPSSSPRRLFWLGVPRRRAARRCRRVDALPRLLAQARRVGPEPVRRRARTSSAIAFLRRFNEIRVPRVHPDVQVTLSPRSRRRGRWCREPA